MFDLNSYSYNPHGIALILSGIAALALGFFVWSQDIKSLKNFSFFSITLSSFIWLLGFGMMAFSQSSILAGRWFLFSYLGVPLISPTFHLFAVTWLDLKHQLKTAMSCFILGTVFSAAMLVGQVHLVEIKKFWWGYFDVFKGYGLIYFGAFLTFFYTTALKAFYHFYTAWKHEKLDLKRKQISYILAAFLIAYIGSCDYIPTLNISFYPFGYLPILLFLTIVSYSIIKHKLLNIQIVIRRAALLTLIYVVSLCVFLGLDWPFYQWISTKIGQRWSIPFLVITGSMLFSLGAFIYAHMIQSASFFKEQIISGVTHEFKSPLASIQSASQVLKEEFYKLLLSQPLSSAHIKVADYLLMIQNNSQRLEKFIQQLLEVAKIEQGGTVLKKQETDIKDLCWKTLELYRPLAEQKNLQLQFTANGVHPISCDSEKIQMVISNLLSNAIKFTERGQVEVSIEQSDKETTVSVKDTGIGIPEDDLPHIFDKFYQGKNGNGCKGTGLGLSIVKGWVEAHGGRVWVESEGTGAMFTLTLPQSKEPS